MRSLPRLSSTSAPLPFSAAPTYWLNAAVPRAPARFASQVTFMTRYPSSAGISSTESCPAHRFARRPWRGRNAWPIGPRWRTLPPSDGARIFRSRRARRRRGASRSQSTDLRFGGFQSWRAGCRKARFEKFSRHSDVSRGVAGSLSGLTLALHRLAVSLFTRKPAF